MIICDVADEFSKKIAYHNLPVPRGSFSSVRSLLKTLHHAEWQFLGADSACRALLPFVVWELPEDSKRLLTTQLGHLNNMWIGTKSALDKDGNILDYQDGKSPVTYVNRSAISLTTTFSEKQATKPQTKKFIDTVLQINDLGVIAPIIGWSIASLLKSRLFDLDYRFPFLNIFGTQGSGKTSTIQQVVQGLTGYSRYNSVDCNTTMFSLLMIFSSTSDVPVYLSEYRRTLTKIGDGLHRLLLLHYDEGIDYRGKVDQTLVKYRLTSPVVIDGNERVSDSALLERAIQIRFSKDTLRNGSKTTDIQNLKQFDINAIFTRVVLYILSLSDLDIKDIYFNAERLMRQAYPDLKLDIRVRHNHTLLIFGLLVLYQSCGKQFDLDVEQICSNSLENITMSTGYVKLEGDEFIEDFITGIADGSVKYNQFENPIYKWEDDIAIVWINVKTCLPWWIKKQAGLNTRTLDTASIKSQLKERTGSEEDQYLLPGKSITVNSKTWWCIGVDLEKARTVLELPENEKT